MLVLGVVRIFQPVHGYDVRRELVSWHAEGWGNVAPGSIYNAYAAGLWLKSEDALAPLLNMVSVPVLLLSGILLPMTLAPRWLYRLSQANPFSHIVDAARASFRGDLGNSSIIVGLACAGALAIVGLATATRVFQRESA
jgi:ABC-2 type transport system permease protein